LDERRDFMYREEWWVNAKAMRKQGMSYKDIGLALGMDWRTAKKLCESEEPHRPRKRERSSKLDKFKPLIDTWLEMRPKMQASLITARLEGLGYDGSYTIVKDYVRKRKREMANLAVMRFETVPGYQAQADFGKLKVQFLSGWAHVIFLVVMLGFSRLRRTTLVPDETRTSLISGLTDTFYATGGVTYEILLDNLKPVVVRPRSRDEEAVLAEEWLRFCAYYGITTNPCWPHRAQTKGKVERLMGPVKSFLSSHTFLDRKHLATEVAAWDHAYNSRVHSTTGQAPYDRFELERPYLLPLPEEPFFYARTEVRRISRDCFVSFEGNRYSAPAAYAGAEVKVRATPTEVHLLSREGAMICAHRRRERGLGVTVMVEEHYRGVPGAERAFSHLEKLQEMGLSPFQVEKRDLSVYEAVASGDQG
jgi:transposase